MNEYIAPNPFEGKSNNELIFDVLDFGLIGMAVLGIRAILEPELYDLNNEIVKRGVDTARACGWIKENTVYAPMDVLEIAFPRKDNNGYQ